MGERTETELGTFCWTDLSTTDPDAAKDFYGTLFGWEAEDTPVPGGSVYSVMRLGGKDVAGIFCQPQQQRDAGVPPMWNTYVSVSSADETAERAKELGAQVHAGPFDVMDAGRMAVIQDPQGAFVMPWEPRRSSRRALADAPGALAFNELASPDPDAAAAFYGELFGWTTEPGEGGVLTIRNGEAATGAIREARPGEAPHWLVYFGTDDLDRSLGRIDALQGCGPMELGMGATVARDPQGAAFALRCA